MAQTVPQHSTFSLKFASITYASTSTAVSLADIDDFIIAISHPRITDTPILQLSWVDSPSRFVIDTTNNTVTVIITEPAIIDVIGKYYVNLWLIEGVTKTTHLTETFSIVTSVNYQ